jgi:hypothetical protein
MSKHTIMPRRAFLACSLTAAAMSAPLVADAAAALPAAPAPLPAAPAPHPDAELLALVAEVKALDDEYDRASCELGNAEERAEALYPPVPDRYHWDPDNKGATDDAAFIWARKQYLDAKILRKEACARIDREAGVESAKAWYDRVTVAFESAYRRVANTRARTLAGIRSKAQIGRVGDSCMYHSIVGDLAGEVVR